MSIVLDYPTQVKQDAQRVLEAPTAPRNAYPAQYRPGQRVEFKSVGGVFTGTISSVEQKPDTTITHYRPKYRITPDPKFQTYVRTCFETQILACIDDMTDDDMLARGHRYAVMQSTDPELYAGSFFMLKSDFVTQYMSRRKCRVWALLDNLDEAHDKMHELQLERDSRTVFVEEYEYLAATGVALPRISFERRCEIEANMQEIEQIKAKLELQVRSC